MRQSLSGILCVILLVVAGCSKAPAYKVEDIKKHHARFENVTEALRELGFRPARIKHMPPNIHTWRADGSDDWKVYYKGPEDQRVYATVSLRDRPALPDSGFNFPGTMAGDGMEREKRAVRDAIRDL